MNKQITVKGEILEEVDHLFYRGNNLDNHELMQTSEPESVKQEQPSNSCRTSGDQAQRAQSPR
ncbi:hypothetical protein DPMN_166642 [Dreissena polymorpha]|uniref:Uncharacterized protein n=1 Tax=Dreissena polymorpha TaxID=45954 RepID=A0A9D4EYZ9_DREPO|nr:hypothetical protein DPMN_166642 [Dreissena polymorpha]